MTSSAELPASSSAPSSAPPSRDRVILLATGSMRARQRPRAIVYAWLYEAVVGAVLATPFAAYVRAALGAHPNGDAALWEDGGLPLASLVQEGRHALGAMLSGATLVLVLAWIGSVVPLALLVASIAHTTADLRAPRLRQLWPRVVPAVRPLLALLAGMSLIELAFAGVAVAAGVKSASASEASLGEPRAAALGAAVSALLFAAVAAAGVVHDLARAAVVRFRQPAWGALKIAARTFARAPSRLLWSWAWRAAAALAPVVAAAALTSRVDVRAGWPLAALFALHQLVVLARVALRASWLAEALRAVDAALRTSSQRA